jgi:CRISPR-associated protein Cmr5
MQTRNQKWAQAAYAQVNHMQDNGKQEEYKRFCKSFPAMIQNCGLCQAVAFAQAKGKEQANSIQMQYLSHLQQVLQGDDAGITDLARQSRESDLLVYQRLSQNALIAAGWLKRYAEALLKG